MSSNKTKKNTPYSKAVQEGKVEKAKKDLTYLRTDEEGSIVGSRSITGADNIWKADLAEGRVDRNGNLGNSANLYIPDYRLSGTVTGVRNALQQVGVDLNTVARYDAANARLSANQNYLAEVRQKKEKIQQEKKTSASVDIFAAGAILHALRVGGKDGKPMQPVDSAGTGRTTSVTKTDLWARLNVIFKKRYLALQENAKDKIKNASYFLDVSRINLNGTGASVRGYKSRTDKLAGAHVGVDKAYRHTIVAPLPRDVVLENPTPPEERKGAPAEFLYSAGTMQPIYLGMMISHSLQGIRRAMTLLGYPENVIEQAVQAGRMARLQEVMPPTAKKGKKGKKGSQESTSPITMGGGLPPTSGVTASPGLVQQQLPQQTFPATQGATNLPTLPQAGGLPTAQVGQLPPLNQATQQGSPNGQVGQLPPLSQATQQQGLPGLPQASQQGTQQALPGLPQASQQGTQQQGLPGLPQASQQGSPQRAGPSLAPGGALPGLPQGGFGTVATSPR